MRLDPSILLLSLLAILLIIGCPAGDDDDSSAGDDDAGDDDDSVPLCPDGVPVREFVDAESDHGLYARAADVTLTTTGGEWNLKESWTGCDVYLFIQDKPKQTNGWPTPLWSRDVQDLLYSMPDNVHLFFTSNEADQVDRDAALAGLQAQVTDAVSGWEAADQQHWAEHIHYLPGRATELPDWVGMHFYATNWGCAIDRSQRVRFIGSYADWARYDQGQQWFEPNLRMAANEPVYYNFEAARAYRLEQQDATVVTLWDGEVLSDPGWAGEKGYVEVELPDAATMAGFNRLEFDHYLGCDGGGEYGTCPAWDYINHLYLCDVDDPDTCNTEFGRWITTYHREGRWVHDASPLLPLIRDGGTRRFAYYTQQPYEVHLDLRLFQEEGEPTAEEATYLFSGAGFNATYNDNFSPVELQVPADAVRVEIATVITGHGMSMPGNCAEFCETTHHFFVNDNENVRQIFNHEDNTGCMDQTGEGTVPNQYGTWWYGRSDWCPGKDVPVVSIDVTDQVNLGAGNEFRYEGYYNGSPYTGDSANIVMTSWLVVYR